MLVDQTIEAKGFDPVKCAGCGELTPVSTKVGVPIACACGVVHTVVGVLVAAKGESAGPKAKS